MERGVVVSYETIRRWGRKFGPTYAKQLRRKKPSRADIWHLGEVVICIAERKHWLWRAVDQAGYVLDEIVQTRRDTKAAKRLLIRLLRKQGLMPKRIVTDKLRLYGAAKREITSDVEHRPHKVSTTGRRTLTYRCENEKGRCRDFDRPAARSASYRSFQQSEISSSHHLKIAQLSPPTSIESAPWRGGRP
ncbi:IS6 family transposase [Rhizobium sp. MC63]|uniref:IS6 family transposase n=1 Tax=Rhizobium mulingense TaxID=3031128 RepID=A0ACC6N2L0_9HYPH|nr:IS6 family transposase [Rhizobium sp. MC63]MDF0699496.1 IS6 family transposase [Rhizobium sp. MC63]MEA3519814.1 IS6 family transposase [Rhizobium sp. MJ31]